MDKLYISLEPQKFEIKHAILSVSFQTPYDHCFDITKFRVMLYNTSGVKYPFVVRFSICHVYNKDEDKQIMLNILIIYTSLESFFHLKRGLGGGGGGCV